MLLLTTAELRQFFNKQNAASRLLQQIMGGIVQACCRRNKRRIAGLQRPRIEFGPRARLAT